MMAEDLFVIISNVPEHISKCIFWLRPFTSNFLFFSNTHSFLNSASARTKVKLIIIDSSWRAMDITKTIKDIRQRDAFGVSRILVITDDADLDSGVKALNAGANDYLPLGLVDKELTARVRMRLSTLESSEPDINLDMVFPLEDRMILKNALHHIRNNLSMIKTVSDLSCHVGKAEREINRAFRIHLGKTAFEYMRDYRINQAKELLFETRLPVIQIAEEVGYSNAANFSTAFKSVVGMSPRAYRTQHLAQQGEKIVSGRRTHP